MFFLRIDVAFILQSIHTQCYTKRLKAMALIFLPVPGKILSAATIRHSFSDVYHTVIFQNNLILIREIYSSSHFQRPKFFYLHTMFHAMCRSDPYLIFIYTYSVTIPFLTAPDCFWWHIGIVIFVKLSCRTYSVYFIPNRVT